MKNIAIFFRESKPFHQFLGLLFLLLFCSLLAVGAVSVLPSDCVGDGQQRVRLVELLVMQVVEFLLPVLVFVWLYHGRPSAYLKFDFRLKKWGLVCVAIVIWLLLVPVNDWLSWWNLSWNDQFRHFAEESNASIDELLQLSQPGDLALQLMAVALAPAVCEELLFRGSLQQILQRWFGNAHVAIVVTAAVFSLAHGELFGFAPRFLLGLLLGYLFYLSGSILVNMCVHFVNNASVVIFFYLYHHGVVYTYPLAHLFMPIITTTLCTLAAVALFLVYFTKLGRKTDE